MDGACNCAEDGDGEERRHLWRGLVTEALFTLACIGAEAYLPCPGILTGRMTKCTVSGFFSVDCARLMID